MKRYLPFLIIAAVGLSALSTGALLYRAKTRRVVSTIDPGQAIHIRGDVHARVTLEEFGDFQCPPCAGLSTTLAEIEKQYATHLRVIFRHLPLTMTHQHALESASAAEAADLQGKFWEMHDLLYKNQALWSKAPDVSPLFNAYAGLLGLDLRRFNRDRTGDIVKARIADDQAKAASMKITNTPTVFVNGRALKPSSLSPEGIRDAIESALHEKKQE